MPATFITTGPGTLKFGPTGSGSFDASCQVTNMLVDSETDSEDPIHVLCGDTVAGEETTAFTLKATFLQDDLKSNGLTAYTWDNSGKTVAFEFVPNTVNGAKVAGRVTVRPMPIGGEVKKRNTHDIEWAIVGTPTPTWSTTQAEAGTGGA